MYPDVMGKTLCYAAKQYRNGFGFIISNYTERFNHTCTNGLSFNSRILLTNYFADCL